MGTSLTDFAKTRGAKHTATPWMERLPGDILEECKAGWKAGLRATTIVEWLIEQGYEDASSGKVAWLATHA